MEVDVFTSVIELNMQNSPQSLSSQSMLTGTRSKNSKGERIVHKQSLHVKSLAWCEIELPATFAQGIINQSAVHEFGWPCVPPGKMKNKKNVWEVKKNGKNE